MPVAAGRVQAEQHMEECTTDNDKLCWGELLFWMFLKPLQSF